MGKKRHVLERFWEKVNKNAESGCWEWTASRIDRRYGQLWVCKTNIRAHRLSWMIHFGAIPEGMVVMHLCDNTICVKPDHLKLGYQIENLDDMMLKSRQRILRRLSEHEKAEMRLMRSEGFAKYDIAETIGVCIRTVDRIIGPDKRGKRSPDTYQSEGKK